jgi:hypothetical protein
MRPALALSLALGLSACGGGGKATFTIGGEVSGVVYDDLTLTSNGMTITVAPPTTAGAVVKFAFPNQIEYGDVYNVQIAKHPKHQKCDWTPPYPTNSDTAGRLAVINVRISCAVNAYPIGGKISGLTADGLVLANGSTGGTLTLAKATAPFDYAMPVAVTYGQTYGVTVITQPTGLFCTVSNPIGTMADAAVTNINVDCVPRT